MKVKEESEKVGLNLNIQKMKIMASGPITSWEIVGETVEIVALGWAPSGNESLPVSLGASRLRPALWAAGWLSGATCLSVALF